MSRNLSFISKRLTPGWQKRPKYTRRQRTHRILRSWSPGDLSSGKAVSYAYQFDGFVTDILYTDSAVLQPIITLSLMGKLFWRYINTFNYPFSYTRLGGPALWHDYWRHTWQFSGSAAGSPTKYRMLLTSRTPDIVACFFGYVAPPPGLQERYELTPFKLFSLADLDLVATKVASLSRDLAQNGAYLLPNAGTFLDNQYLEVVDWHIPNDAAYGSGHGNTKETPPYLATAWETPGYQTDWTELKNVYGDGGSWATHTDRVTYLANKIMAIESASGMLPDGTAPYSIQNVVFSGPVNGKQFPMPWYFENVFHSGARSYADSVREWRLDPRNIISAWLDGGDQTWTEAMALITMWGASEGGWIAFTGTDAAAAQVDAAYEEAARMRAQVSA